MADLKMLVLDTTDGPRFFTVAVRPGENILVYHEDALEYRVNHAGAVHVRPVITLTAPATPDHFDLDAVRRRLTGAPVHTSRLVLHVANDGDDKVVFSVGSDGIVRIADVATGVGSSVVLELTNDSGGSVVIGVIPPGTIPGDQFEVPPKSVSKVSLVTPDCGLIRLTIIKGALTPEKEAKEQVRILQSGGTEQGDLTLIP